MSKYQVNARIEVTVYVDAPDEDSAYFLADHLIDDIWYPDEVELQIANILEVFEVKDEN